MGQSRPAVHRTIVVVDVEGFGDPRRTNAHQVAVRAGLYRALRHAFDDATMSWTDCDHEDRGDGVFILAPADMPKALFIDAVPPLLVAALRDHNAAHSAEERIRLRMALHAGEVELDEHGVTAASVNLAFRLLDARPLKAALADSPGILAVITSDWFFDEVVRHSRKTDPATFRPHRVAVKETSALAWISLPDYPYPSAPAHLSSRPFTSSSASDQPGTSPVPQQLPLAIRDFTGRAAHLAALDALLPENGDADPDAVGTAVISALDGTAGVGKTALAVHWAHRVQHRFPEGTLYADLRGYGPVQPVTPTEILDGFLHALGCQREQIPIGLQAQSGLYRSLLARRRVLIVLDNATSAEQVRPLLPGSSGCVTLITSRASLTGLVVGEAATRLTLDLLGAGEALDLVRGILGTDRVVAEPAAVATLIRICARLPLALRIAASRAASRPHQSIADLVTEMDAVRARLDALSTHGDQLTSVRAVFDWSYQRLDSSQARLFRRLGLHPGPEMSLHAAAAAADLDLPEAGRLLDALADTHLLETVARNRYRLHDLLHAYATDCAQRHDPRHEHDHVRRTLLEWYARRSLAASQALYPALTDWHPLASTDTHVHHPIDFASPADALTWLETEQVNLIAAAHHAADHDLPQPVILISHTAWATLFRWGVWKALFDLVKLGLAAARRSGDRHCECFALLELSDVYLEVGQRAQAFAVCQEALALARTLGEPWLEAWALNDLGWCEIAQGRHNAAMEYLRQALPLSKGAQRGRLQGVVETNLSVALGGLGHYEQALSHAERGLALCREGGDQDSEAHVLGQVARAHQGLGAHSEVIALCEQAVSVARDHCYPPHTAATLDTLGISLHHLGHTIRAISCWREALAIFNRYADHRGAALRERLQAVEKTVRQPSKELQ